MATSVKAESIYAGTFRQLAATIVSIDAAAGEMKVTDLATKKPLFIRVNSDSTMKKLPDQLAQMLARRYGVAAAARGGNRGPGDQAAGDGGRRRRVRRAAAAAAGAAAWTSGRCSTGRRRYPFPISNPRTRSW